MLLSSDRGCCVYKVAPYMGLNSVRHRQGCERAFDHNYVCAADRSAVNANAMGLANANPATPTSLVTASTATPTTPTWVSATVTSVSATAVASVNCAKRRKSRRMQKSGHPLLHLQLSIPRLWPPVTPFFNATVIDGQIGHHKNLFEDGI